MLEVVAALIWDEGKFLICQRPENKARGLNWEFVGGKVEEGETKEQALVRECREELDINIEVGGVFCEVTHEYPEVVVHLTVYECIILKGTPKLLEHNALKWITSDEISEYVFCPADREILKKISETYNGQHFMRLDEAPFKAIKSGKKKIEVRLYDEKRRKIKEGDVICFSRTDSSFEKIRMQVVALHRYDTFTALFDEVGTLAGGGTAEKMYSYYTPENEHKYKVLGIEIKRANCIKIEHYSWNVDSIYRYFDKTELLEFFEKLSEKTSEKTMEDPVAEKAMLIIAKKMYIDANDMPASPSWDYWEFQEAAVAALCALVKKPTDRRCDVLKRARGKKERAKGRDKEIYARIVYELETANMRHFDGLKEYLKL